MNSSALKGRRITIIGNRGGTNVGGAFERAALAADLDVQMLEPKAAMEAPVWLRRFNWYLRGRRPTWLNQFSRRVVESCLQHKSEIVVVTGIAGMNADALRQLRDAGIKVANYLTDDPWNPVHRASWFFEALPEYAAIFSPRRTNVADLEAIGCTSVHYLPFAYDPTLHFPEMATDIERDRLATDVLFVGGADEDRVPICAKIAGAGLSLAIYGDYWDRFNSTAPYWKGYADLLTLRKATATARVCLCLTRRANRDGHTMRSYEVAAMEGVILAEETDDHIGMFGEEGNCALYFRDTAEMISKAKWLVGDSAEARQMAERAHSRITNGANTYRDRLGTIVATCLS